MISKRELEENREPAVVRAIQPLPWRTALRSLNLVHPDHVSLLRVYQLLLSILA